MESRDSLLESRDSLLESRDSLLESRDSHLKSSDSLLESRDSLLGSRDSLLNSRDSPRLQGKSLETHLSKRSDRESNPGRSIRSPERFPPRHYSSRVRAGAGRRRPAPTWPTFFSKVRASFARTLPTFCGEVGAIFSPTLRTFFRKVRVNFPPTCSVFFRKVGEKTTHSGRTIACYQWYHR